MRLHISFYLLNRQRCNAIHRLNPNLKGRDYCFDLLFKSKSFLHLVLRSELVHCYLPHKLKIMLENCHLKISIDKTRARCFRDSCDSLLCKRLCEWFDTDSFSKLILKSKSKSHVGIGLQVWFQNARAKFRRNVLRQENGGVDKADGTSIPPPSSDSGALTPPSSAATLTDLTNPSITVVTSVTSSLDSHDSGSPSQTTLTNLF